MAQTKTKIDLWRRQREKRRARLLANEMRRKPIDIRPGGNIYAGQIPGGSDDQYRPDYSRYAGLAPRVVSPSEPVAKHVTQNTWRAGSMALTFFGWGYWLPNAAQSK